MHERDERYYNAKLSHQHCSRRGLFRGLWSGVSKPVKAQSLSVAERTVARPPTAVDEKTLSRLCNQCGECAKRCPQHVITMVNGLPELSLDASSCNECGECQRVCPTLALAAATKQTGAMATISGMCIRQMGAPCSECQAVCSHGAIELQPRNITINKEACTGCGQCRHECPASVIFMTVV